MRKVAVLSLLLIAVLAVVPAATADQFNFTFSTPVQDGSGNSGPFVVSGTLFGTATGTPHLWNITSGTIVLNGSTDVVSNTDGITHPIIGSGLLIANPNSPNPNQIGYFLYDDLLAVPPGAGKPFVDSNGLLFQLTDGTNVNIFSGWQNQIGGTIFPFMGSGTNTYDLFESNGYNERGELNVAATPEPASLALLGAGLLGFGGLFRRRR